MAASSFGRAGLGDGGGEGLQPQPQRGEWGAQLVGGVSDEPLLGVAELRELGGRGVERLGQGAELGGTIVGIDSDVEVAGRETSGGSLQSAYRAGDPAGEHHADDGDDGENQHREQPEAGPGVADPGVESGGRVGDAHRAVNGAARCDGHRDEHQVGPQGFRRTGTRASLPLEGAGDLRSCREVSGLAAGGVGVGDADAVAIHDHDPAALPGVVEEDGVDVGWGARLEVVLDQGGHRLSVALDVEHESVVLAIREDPSERDDDNREGERSDGQIGDQQPARHGSVSPGGRSDSPRRAAS